MTPRLAPALALALPVAVGLAAGLLAGAAASADDGKAAPLPEAVLDPERPEAPTLERPEGGVFTDLAIEGERLTGALEIHWAPDGPAQTLRILGIPGATLADVTVERGIGVEKASAKSDGDDLVVPVALGPSKKPKLRDSDGLRNLDPGAPRSVREIVKEWSGWLEAFAVSREQIKKDQRKLGRRVALEDAKAIVAVLLPLARIADGDRAAIGRLTLDELRISANAMHQPIPRTGEEEDAPIDELALRRLLVRKIRGVIVRARVELPIRPPGAEEDANASWLDPESVPVAVGAEHAVARRLVLRGSIGAANDPVDWWWLPNAPAELIRDPARSGGVAIAVEPNPAAPDATANVRAELVRVAGATTGVYIRVRVVGADGGSATAPATPADVPMTYGVAIDLGSVDPEAPERVVYEERARPVEPRWPY